jgi:hypothetical protein
MVDRIIALLRARDMLSGRRKRMLIWSMLLESLTHAFQRPRPAIKDALGMWRVARERSLIAMPAYYAGSSLILLQWLNVVGFLPRELARVAIYFDLRRQPFFHTSLFRAVRFHLKWYFAIYRRRAQSRKTVGDGPRAKAEASSVNL